MTLKGWTRNKWNALFSAMINLIDANSKCTHQQCMKHNVVSQMKHTHASNTYAILICIYWNWSGDVLNKVTGAIVAGDSEEDLGPWIKRKERHGMIGNRKKEMERKGKEWNGKQRNGMERKGMWKGIEYRQQRNASGNSIFNGR